MQNSLYKMLSTFRSANFVNAISWTEDHLMQVLRDRFDKIPDEVAQEIFVRVDRASLRYKGKKRMFRFHDVQGAAQFAKFVSFPISVAQNSKLQERTQLPLVPGARNGSEQHRMVAMVNDAYFLSRLRDSDVTPSSVRCVRFELGGRLWCGILMDHYDYDFSSWSRHLLDTGRQLPIHYTFKELCRLAVVLKRYGVRHTVMRPDNLLVRVGKGGVPEFVWTDFERALQYPSIIDPAHPYSQTPYSVSGSTRPSEEAWEFILNYRKKVLEAGGRAPSDLGAVPDIDAMNAYQLGRFFLEILDPSFKFKFSTGHHAGVRSDIHQSVKALQKSMKRLRRYVEKSDIPYKELVAPAEQQWSIETALRYLDDYHTPLAEDSGDDSEERYLSQSHYENLELEKSLRFDPDCVLEYVSETTVTPRIPSESLTLGEGG